MKKLKWRIEYDGWQKDFELSIWEDGHYATWGHYKTEDGAIAGAKRGELKLRKEARLHGRT